MPESRRAGDTIAVVIVVVGAIGQVKGLGDQLKVDVLPDAEVLGQSRSSWKNGSPRRGSYLATVQFAAAPPSP